MSTKTTNLSNMLHDPSLLETRGYLAGDWVSGDKNQTFDVINPARGDTIGKVANLSRKQISAAIDNAYEAQKEWANSCLLYTSPSPRDKRQSRMPSSA